MKTKLLKKLRAKARKKYWIEYRPDCVCHFLVKEDYLDGIEGIIVGVFSTKDEALECLKKKRRKYILSKLSRRIYD